MRTLTLPICVALAASPALAQHLCEGNGHGGAYVEVGPAYLGGLFRHDVGSPNVPNGVCFFSISDGFQETVHPLAGPICLDVFSPFYDVIVLPTGPDGNLHFELYLPDVPSWVGNPPFYSNVTTIEGGQLSISKTVPLWFANPDAWHETGSMAVARILHTGTYLGADGRDDRIRVLVAGGASGGTVTVPTSILASTEIFDPLSRTFSAGPDLSVERAAHTATRLQDGRVLIAGGVGAGGERHAAELFDLDAGTMTPTGSMTAPRLGHTATLLADGRVLVTGGFAHYQDPAGAWEAALDSAQATAELYDPATGAWTAIAQPMASPRAGHSATLLPDGRVLIAGGVREGVPSTSPLAPGTLPLFTPTADLYQPATGAFVAAADMPGGTAFHGASLLPSGDVLITAGMQAGALFGEAAASAYTKVWDGATWSFAGFLPFSTAWHAQLALDDGTVLVAGGLVAGDDFIPAIASAGFHDPAGSRTTPATSIGVNQGIPGSAEVPVGAAAAVRMHDGALLLIGGAIGDPFASPTARAFVYTPPKP